MVMVLGLTKDDLEKPTMVAVDEVHVHDGKGGSAKVHIGDQVEVFEPDKHKNTLDYLGPGPYTIEWLAQWRCGRNFVQLSTLKNGNGKGVNACKLKIIV
jgi:hypothetical protein